MVKYYFSIIFTVSIHHQSQWKLGLVQKWYKNSLNYLFSYQKRVPIKFPHVGKWVTSGPKEQSHMHRFHMPTGSYYNYLIKQHVTGRTDIQWIFFVGSVHIWHQLYPETVVSWSTTSKNHPKYALPVMPPPNIIWPILHIMVFWLWN